MSIAAYKTVRQYKRLRPLPILVSIFSGALSVQEGAASVKFQLIRNVVMLTRSDYLGLVNEKDSSVCLRE